LATRRKYRQPQGYKDGGAVIPDKVVAAPPIEAPIAAEPVMQSHRATALSDDDNPLIRAHAATLRAEELHRQAAQRPPTVEEHIDQIPGLTSHKRAFLKQHPKMATDPEESRAMSFHYQAALAAGVPDDSEEMDRAILAGMYREREYQAKDKAPADAAPRAPIAAPRKSLPVSAPVSRQTVSHSTGRPMSSKMTLSAEERDIARRSIINRPDMPPLSDAQKEYIYLQNRNRYRSMLADGSYSEQRGSGTFRAGHRDD
jgi:hypothetical protein